MTTPPLDVPSSGPAPVSACGCRARSEDPHDRRPAATRSIHLLTICSVLLASSVAYGTSGCNAGARRSAMLARGPATSLRAGAAPCIDPPHWAAGCIDPSHWGRLAAPALRTGVADSTGRGCRRHRGGDTPLPRPATQRQGAGPSPASQHPAHHARRDNGRTPKLRGGAETTVERKVPAPPAAEATPERRDHCVRIVASALHRCLGSLGRTTLPLAPLPCVRIDWSAQSLAPASACGHASGRAPSHAQDHAKPTPVRLDK